MKLLVLRRLVTQCLALLVFFSSSTNSFGVISTQTSWQPVISPTKSTPPGFVAVDKKRQQLFFLQRSTPLKVSNSYLCSTGQVVGDKFIEGDLRTPEGIYFVVRHITSGLNFSLYGKEAYTLNYPNPVDKLNKKTGYGIWIHGRGPGIAPLQTQGCIALNNKDLDVLGKVLKPGTPVLLSSSFMQTASLPALNLKTKQLDALVKSWAKAWENRSTSMFDYYDESSYSLSTESFSNFKSNKESIFKSLPWIKNSIENIQILQGPNYWVTWFYQNYEAPNLTTKGVRRLYWKEDSKKGFKIVGMEWVPGQSTDPFFALTDDNSSPLLPEELPRTEPQTEEFLNNEDITYSDKEDNQVAIAKAEAEQKARAEAIAKAEAEQKARAEAIAKAEAERLAMLEAKAKKEELPLSHTFDSAKDNQTKLESLVNSWAKAWENRSAQMFDFYDPALYSKNTESFSRFKANKKQVFESLDWIKINIDTIQVSQEKEYWVTAFNQKYSASNLTVKGVRRLYWKDFGKDGFKIVRMSWAQGKKLAVKKSDAPVINTPKEVSAIQNISAKNTKEVTQETKAIESIQKDITTPSIVNQEIKKKKLERLVFDWAKAWKDRSSKMFSYYDKVAYSKNTESFDSFVGTKKRLFKNLPWIKTKVYPVHVFTSSHLWVTEFYMEYEAPNLKANGVRKLYWKENSKGEFHIVRMEFDPKGTSSSVPIQKNVTDESLTTPHKNEVLKEQSQQKNAFNTVENELDNRLEEAFDLVERWRKAWQKGDIEEYISYYANNAVQGTRKGKSSIKAQKQLLWSQTTPVFVTFKNMRMTALKNGIHVEMIQEYIDAAKNTDKGVKTLNIELVNGKLLITDEQWKVAP